MLLAKMEKIKSLLLNHSSGGELHSRRSQEKWGSATPTGVQRAAAASSRETQARGREPIHAISVSN